jgi:hypothetical protein
VLGLADQVGGDVRGVGGVVSEDGDLGGPRLGVDADAPLEQPLGGRHVHVAGARHELDRGALLGAVREHRDRLGAACRVHLLDPQQGTGREHGGVRQAAEVALRRGGDGQGGDARLLRGHHVHHHGRRVDRPAARHVQPDPLHGQPPLGDRAAGDDAHRGVGAALVTVDQPGAARGLLQRRADGRVQLLQGAGQLLRGNAGTGDPAAVEALRVLHERRGPAMPHVLADGPHLFQGGLDVEFGAGQQVAVDPAPVRSVSAGWGGIPQIDSGDHRAILADRPSAPGARISG